MNTQFTELYYDYADEHNHKAGETIYFSGVFTLEQLSAMQEHFNDHEFFIPHQVGLDALQPRLESFPSDADHVWHRLYLEENDVTVLDALPEGKTAVGTADEFFTRFMATEWDLCKEYERLGLDEA
jgi:hypothetical protein